MSLPILIIGAGGHAAVVLDVIRTLGLEPLGFADKVAVRRDGEMRGLPVIGDDAAIVLRFQPASVMLANGVGGAASTLARRRVFVHYVDRGFQFMTLVHPSATVARSVRLGAGAQVMAGSVLQPEVAIGQNTIVNTQASIDHDCVVGDHVHVAPGVTLSGSVSVGDGAHLGAGCVVIQGVRIGEGALVAAGAVVVKDVPPMGRVAGSPARAMRI